MSADASLHAAVAGHGALHRLRDRLSLLQIAIATATVAIAGGISNWSLGGAAALAALAFLRPLPPAPSRAAERLWTVGIAAALVATLVRAVTSGEVLDAGIDFLLLLVVQRLFNRQRAREHMQLLLLGSLLIVTGAVINAGINYPLLFTAYLGVAVMTLLLNHLAAEGERLGARTAASVAREGMRSRAFLWRAAAQVGLIAAIGAVVTFVAFPRWGVGFFLRGGLARDNTSGFSSTVDLGDFGRIKTDNTVVMRIEPDGGDAWGPRPTWHLRGSSFDAYGGGRWWHRADVEATLVPGGFVQLLRRPGATPPLRASRRALPELVPLPGFAASTEMLFATVTLEDIGVDVLFAASEPAGVRLSPRGLLEQRYTVRGGKSDELRAEKAPGPIRYQFVSRIGTPTRAELQALGRPTATPELAPYLARAPGLTPAVAELARRLGEGQRTRLDQVEAVMAHLGGFRYTLDNRPSERVLAGADPIEGFLFDTQAGHCEYFATAMVLLLRELDVPARIVNGYYGAHWNQVGEYYAVRQADAHSWVEVDFGALGWVTFDPTPPGGRVAGDEAGWWPAAAELVDAVRNAYLEWIIDYDLGKQLTLFENLGLRDRGATTALARWRPLLFALGGAGLLAWIVARWRRARRAPPRLETALWRTLQARLARRGHLAGAAESVPRFCGRVARSEPALAAALVEFARRYEAARFGDADAAAIAALRSASRAMLAALRDAPRPPAPPP